jgi:hypothetical protein
VTQPAPTVETTLHEGVALVEILRGPDADPSASPGLLVEVPHGADERAHYDALRARLVGDLPADLHAFFHVNTDIGAWQYGRRVAELLIAARPALSALVVRSLIPRTFIDCNRLEDTPDALEAGGLTAGIPSYVEHPDDRTLLVGLHRRYVQIIEDAYAEVCDAGGFALTPHTYGPYELPIARIDRDIVRALRDCHRPEVISTLPVRPEVDLLTRSQDGVRYAPEGMVDDLVAGFREAGLSATEGAAYRLQAGTQTWRFVTRYPEQLLCLEIRRDLLVTQYTGLEEMAIDQAAIARVSAPLAGAIGRWMDRRQAEGAGW